LNLALEDNDFEKVSELCEHFHLDEALILPGIFGASNKGWLI
jgi:hypothetical protein